MPFHREGHQLQLADFVEGDADRTVFRTGENHELGYITSFRTQHQPRGTLSLGQGSQEGLEVARILRQLELLTRKAIHPRTHQGVR